MLNDLNLNHLRVFHSIYALKSLSQAAGAMQVTPSAIHQSIRRLESSLNAPLFVRSGKRYVPTDRAHSLHQLVSPFLHALGMELEAQAAAKGALSGTIRLGSVPEFGRSALVDSALAFQKRHPGVHFAITLSDTGQLQQQLLDGRIELALMDEGPYLERFPQLHAEPVFSEVLVMACSARFYAARIKGDHSFRKLSSLEHVPYHDGEEAIHKWYLHHFNRSPKLQRRISIDHVGGILRAMAAGAGLGVVPAHLIEREFSRGKLRVIDTPRSQMLNKVVAVQLLGRVPPRRDKEFLAHLRTECRMLSGSRQGSAQRRNAPLRGVSKL